MEYIKEPLKVFISYAREDRQYLDMLRKHLRLLERQGLIAIWDDSLIAAGAVWTEEITNALKEADIYLFLVSSDFLASEYIYNHEIELAIQKHEKGDAAIVPIIIRSCDWTSSPIGRFQALPRRGIPLSSQSDVDEALFEVIKGIQIIAETSYDKKIRIQKEAESEKERLENKRLEEERKRHLTEERKRQEAELEQRKRIEAEKAAAAAQKQVYKLEDVFVSAGTPNITFVEPDDFLYIELALLQAGRGIVIEGPSGIGKTTTAIQVLKKTGNNYTLLSARLDKDIRQIEDIENSHEGIIVIDDFHRLSESTQNKVANYLKYLADYGVKNKKLIIIGIPNTGDTLIRLSFDLANRITIFKLGSVKDEKILSLIEKGEKALNIEFVQKTSIVREAFGSLYIAQMLCGYTALKSGINETQRDKKVIEEGVFEVIDRIIKDLSPKFDDLVRFFASIGGRKDKTCIELLKELTLTNDGVLNLFHLKAKRPELKQGIHALLENSKFDEFYTDYPDCKRHLLFDKRVPALIIDDPQLKFYLNNTPVEKLILTTGKSISNGREKVFISYSHADEVWLKKVLLHLKHLEKKGIIDLWVDKRIKPGQKWRDEINKALANTKVAILLISQNFLASDFIVDNEVPVLLQAAEKEGATILQLFIKPCSINSFEELKQFQMLNDIRQPLAGLDEVRQDEVLVKLAEAVEMYMTDESQ